MVVKVQPSPFIYLFALILAAPAGAQESSLYSYDAMGRLVRVDRNSPSSSDIDLYAFDAASNRISVSDSIDKSPHTVGGDFEYPVVSGFAYDPVAPGVNFFGAAGVAADGSAWGFATPWNGTQVSFIQSASNSAGYFEIRAVGLIVGKHYQIAFAVAQRPNYPQNALQVSVNGLLVWNATPQSTTFTPYAGSSFVASSNSAIVRFAVPPTSYDSAIGIDAISVQGLD